MATFDNETAKLLAKQWSGRLVGMLYCNHRNETAARLVNVRHLFHGSTEHHPEPQWLFEALDVERNVVRTFALDRVQDWWFGDHHAHQHADENAVIETRLAAADQCLKGMEGTAKDVYHQARMMDDTQWGCFASLMTKYAELARLKQSEVVDNQAFIKSERDYRSHRVTPRPHDTRYIAEKCVNLFGVEALLLGIELHAGRDAIERYLLKLPRVKSDDYP